MEDNTVKEEVLNYINGLKPSDDIGAFFMTYGAEGDDDEVEVISNLDKETIAIISLMETGVLTNDEKDVIKDIINCAVGRGLIVTGFNN